MARWRSLLIGLPILALVACGGATSTSNQSLSDPAASTAPRGSTAPVAAASAAAASSAATAPRASAGAGISSTGPRASASAGTASAAPRASAGASARAASAPPSVAASAAPSASRSTAPGPSALPQPNGTIPPGWKVFRGPREYPIVMAYPPDWTVDESYFPEQSIIYFIGPSGNTDEESVAIIWGTQQTEANIDVILNDFYQQRSAYCDQEGIESTEYRQISNATFAILQASCDQGGTLFFLQVGAGLKSSDQWDVEMRTLYENKADFKRTIFDPMLESINIYALIPQ